MAAPKSTDANGNTIRSEALVIGTYAQEAQDISKRCFSVGEGTARKQYVLTRNAAGAETLEEVAGYGPLMHVPGRVVQNVRISTTESFQAYLKDFAQASTVIFADADSSAMEGVLDYHERKAGGVAGFGEHTADLSLQFSEEWKAWTGISGKYMAQSDFIRFLDENRADIVSPAAGDIIDLCKDLQSAKKIDVRSVARPDTDHIHFDYEESTELKRSGQLVAPSAIGLLIPVYFGGPAVSLESMLIWNAEGGFKLGVKIKRAAKVREAEFLRIVAEVAEATGTHVIHGRRGTGWKD